MSATNHCEDATNVFASGYEFSRRVWLPGAQRWGPETICAMQKGWIEDAMRCAFPAGRLDRLLTDPVFASPGRIRCDSPIFYQPEWRFAMPVVRIIFRLGG